MNYNKFEDQISDWIENSMDIKQRKEFEKFLSENPEYLSKVESIKDVVKAMKNAPMLKTSQDFNDRLNQRINSLKNEKKPVGIFGFSKRNFAYLTLSVMGILLLSGYLLQPSFLSYSVADDQIIDKKIESEKSDEELNEINDIDILNNVNGSFVTDKD
tara:strand:+ start:5226 stop:5699 length:474 start_codon:yes stop_codon:yes gene_type:complete